MQPRRAADRPPLSAIDVRPPPAERAEAPSGAADRLTIAEVAAATSTSTHTLRYYERIGLIQPIARARSGHRRYGPDDVRWVVFLRRLHETGMPIQRMLAYATLARRGDATISERRALLEAHRDEVARKLAEQQAHLAGIEKKVRMYEELERQLAEKSGRDAPAPGRQPAAFVPSA
ncbi:MULTISPECIES: MerR family transcriptional regulator [Sorangium]|uniref:MerR family transcriptional regulator n=1 Tax=Sorangium atrum TaxID=2995308 RepID=A0ABT5C4A7_9BACT|nr:MerR family transcriptional regulator [Sorangium aterium]MDC0681249.1 MerR family transcriptional regulator [Sorangium aterium]